MTGPILRVNLEETMCVVMKRNSALPEMAYLYFTVVNMLVYVNITNKTHLENHNLF